MSLFHAVTEVAGFAAGIDPRSDDAKNRFY
jgi:hypothetical protein